MMQVGWILLLVPTFCFRSTLVSKRSNLLLLSQKTLSSRTKRTTGLVEWSEANDIQITPRLSLQADDAGGLGWFAQADIPSGSVLLTVPSDQVLQTTTSSDVPWYAQLSQQIHKLSGAWKDSLPSRFDTPLHWSSLQDLQYPYLTKAVAQQEKQWKQYHQQTTSLDYDAFVWGCECARSRAFAGKVGASFQPQIYAFLLLLVTLYVGLDLGTVNQAANGVGVVLSASILRDFVVPKLIKEKNYIVCPMIDMVNHDLAPSATVSFEYFANGFSLASIRNVKAGEQVTISYGERSNDQLLQYYGFVIADNPHDVYVLPAVRQWDLEGLEQACSRSIQPGRLQKLDAAGLLGPADQADPKGVVVSRQGVDPAVIQGLRALVSSNDEWENAKQAVGNFAAPVSDANEACVFKAIRYVLENELASKPTTLDQDQQLLRRLNKPDPEERLALEFRIEKKKLLQETIENL